MSHYIPRRHIVSYQRLQFGDLRGLLRHKVTYGQCGSILPGMLPVTSVVYELDQPHDSWQQVKRGDSVATLYHLTETRKALHGKRDFIIVSIGGIFYCLYMYVAAPLLLCLSNQPLNFQMKIKKPNMLRIKNSVQFMDIKYNVGIVDLILPGWCVHRWSKALRELEEHCKTTGWVE